MSQPNVFYTQDEYRSLDRSGFQEMSRTKITMYSELSKLRENLIEHANILCGRREKEVVYKYISDLFLLAQCTPSGAS